jgi:hypothetical protein
MTTAFLLWYAIFHRPIVGYPNYAKGPCYSPDHAYHVTRHQSFWQSRFISAPDDFETARLFDQSGKLLHEDETLINDEFGPKWPARFEGNPRHPPVVFYQGYRRSRLDIHASDVAKRWAGQHALSSHADREKPCFPPGTSGVKGRRRWMRWRRRSPPSALTPALSRRERERDQAAASHLNAWPARSPPPWPRGPTRGWRSPARGRTRGSRSCPAPSSGR